MSWLQHFEIERRSFGTSTRRYDPLAQREPIGYAYFCPECAQTWALCPIAGKSFQVWSIPCGKHEAELRVSGSIWLPWDEEFNNALPEAVVRREFELHLAYFTQGESNEG